MLGIEVVVVLEDVGPEISVIGVKRVHDRLNDRSIQRPGPKINRLSPQVADGINQTFL